LLLTFTLDYEELVAGAGAAALGATASELVRSQGLLRFHPKLEWFPRALRLPLLLIKDTVTVFGALYRKVARGEPVAGVWRTLEFERGEEEDPRAAARRALVTTAVTFTPNAYVVGIERGEDLMLIHQLVASPDPQEVLERL
jgi:hypothetical protein